MHRLNINICAAAGGVGLPPPPPPLSHMAEAFRLHLAVYVPGFPTLSVFEESKTGLEKEIDYCLGLILMSY